MLGSLEGKKYTTDWDGFFRLLPGFATVVGEEYLNTIPIDDDNILINTVVNISITKDDLFVYFDNYNYSTPLFQLDEEFFQRLKRLLSTHEIRRIN